MLDKEALARVLHDAFHHSGRRNAPDFFALHKFERARWQVIAEAILSEISEQGHAIVPMVPTEAMIEAGQRVDGTITANDVYTAMLIAAGDEG